MKLALVLALTVAILFAGNVQAEDLSSDYSEWGDEACQTCFKTYESHLWDTYGWDMFYFFPRRDKMDDYCTETQVVIDCFKDNKYCQNIDLAREQVAHDYVCGDLFEENKSIGETADDCILNLGDKLNVCIPEDITVIDCDVWTRIAKCQYRIMATECSLEYVQFLKHFDGARSRPLYTRNWFKHYLSPDEPYFAFCPQFTEEVIENFWQYNATAVDVLYAANPTVEGETTPAATEATTAGCNTLAIYSYWLLLVPILGKLLRV